MSIHVVIHDRRGHGRIRWFATIAQAGTFLETVRCPARAVNDAGRVVGACWEIPPAERIGRQRWGWWYDPEESS